MYLGKIVETAPRDGLFYAGRSIPIRRRCCRRSRLPDPKRERARRRIVLEGDVPNPRRSALRLPLPDPLLSGAGGLRDDRTDIDARR